MAVIMLNAELEVIVTLMNTSVRDIIWCNQILKKNLKKYVRLILLCAWILSRPCTKFH